MVTSPVNSTRAGKGAWASITHLYQRVSRWLLHFFALLPLGITVRDFFTGNLTVNPIQEASQRTGDYALVMLLLSLACTPAASIFGLAAARRHRRTLGLYAFFYAGLHFLIFIGLDYSFNFNLILPVLIEKRFILVGFTAGLILLLLAATSNQWSMRKLGKSWKKLHRLVYHAGALVFLHYLWAVKGDIRLPLLAGGILAFLLLLRLPPVKIRLLSVRQKLATRLRS